MNKITKSETSIIISYAGSVITIEKTKFITDILTLSTPDNVKIESIFNHFHIVSRFNNYMKEKITTNANDFIAQQSIKIIKNDYKQLGNIKYQTDDMCKAALDISLDSYKYIKDKNDTINKYVIARNPLLLSQIENQTEELCLMAVTLNGLAIQFVIKKTQAICTAAYENTRFAIQYIDEEWQTADMGKCIYPNIELFKYVKIQTNDICVSALRFSLQNFKYIMNPTLEMYLYVVTNGNPNVYEQFRQMELTDHIMIQILNVKPQMLQYFKHTTPDLDLYAVKKDITAIEHVKNWQNYDSFLWAVERNGLLLRHIVFPVNLGFGQILKINLAAVKQNGLALEYCNTVTEEIYHEAIKNNPMALKYILDAYKTKKLCLCALNINGLALQYVVNKTLEFCNLAVTNNGLALKFVDDKTDEICIVACMQNGLALQFIDNPSLKVCFVACKENIEAIAYVPLEFIPLIM